MKILLVANTAWYLHNFRRNLARRLCDTGADVAAVCPRDEYVARLVDSGMRWIEWPINRGSINSLRELATAYRLYQIYRMEKPQLVHHFTIKCILYGTTAAKLAGNAKIVNSVTGLGHVFLSNRRSIRMLRPLLRRLYAQTLNADNACPMFQNRDDLLHLSHGTPRLMKRAVVTNGSGVDLRRFARGKLDQRTESSGGLDVLFVGRLIREKGIHEYVEAARILRQRGFNASFRVCGNRDPGNPSSVDEWQLETWQREGLVQFLGHVDDVVDVMRRADVVVLPSYREGTPRALLEAAALEKPIVATDVSGCREVVVDARTGFLVPARDPQAVAGATERLLLSPEMRRSMGQAGRQRVQSLFDERTVINQTLEVYKALLYSHRGAARQTLTRRRENRVTSPTSPGSEGRGFFTLSLDFELAWGTRGRPNASRAAPFLQGTRNAITRLLSLLETYEISATWATVGAMLLTSPDTARRHPWLAHQCFGDVPAGDAASQPFWYAHDILEELVSCRTPQELGCHTLTHLLVDPAPSGREAFRKELRLFLELFQQLGLAPPRSFVFPKAKMGHLDVLADAGFRCYRGPEGNWFESLPGPYLPAGLRLLDAKFAAAPPVSHPARSPEGVWCIPSSQFYSPFMSVGKHVSIAARVRKAIRGLHRAARTAGIYHLWTHPFNLGLGTDVLLNGLERIFQEASRLRKAGRLDIASMGAIADQLDGTTSAGRAKRSKARMYGASDLE